MGTFGFTVFNALYYAAAHHTTAVNMTILQGGMPALVLVGAFLFYGTRISILQIAGLGLTLIGVAAVAAQGSLANLLEFHFNVGDVWILLGMVLYSGYTIGLRNRPQVPGLALFSAFAAVAFLTSLPFLAYEIVSGTVLWPTFKGWLVLLFVGLVPSVMAQLFFMRAVELIGPGRAGVFMNLVPVCGALLAVLLLAEPFHLYHAMGLAMVLGGIWVAERGRIV
jgi:drug/metabolite transporter (DMT)-like permease